MSLATTLRETVARHAMLPPGARVLAAVSGGADSTALLHLLVEIRAELQLEIHVAHLDHRWRGDASAADRAFVAGLAARLGLPATCAEAGEIRAAGEGREAAARRVRCRFLEETARRVGADRIATGHTRDDQAETVLLRLLRGAGARGLAGIPPVRLPYVRPLLEASRAAVRDWLRRREIPWREDATNLDLLPARNRVRHRLLPLLQAAMGGDPAARLAAAAALLRDDEAFLEEAAEGRYRSLARPAEQGVGLDAAGLAGLPAALARRVLRRAVQAARGGDHPPDRATVERLGRLVQRGAAGPLDLAGGLRAELRGGVLALRTGAGEGVPSFRTEAAVPGRLHWPDAGISLTLKEVDRARADRDIRDARLEIAYLDLDRTGHRLALRNRRPGDAFYPLGLGGRKKLQDFLVDARIPREARDRVALLTSGGRIVWVVGQRIDDRFKITDATRRVLRVSQEVR